MDSQLEQDAELQQTVLALQNVSCWFFGAQAFWRGTDVDRRQESYLGPPLW
jgi:hypothetical protein